MGLTTVKLDILKVKYKINFRRNITLDKHFYRKSQSSSEK